MLAASPHSPVQSTIRLNAADSLAQLSNAMQLQSKSTTLHARAMPTRPRSSGTSSWHPGWWRVSGIAPYTSLRGPPALQLSEYAERLADRCHGTAISFRCVIVIYD